MFDAQLASYLQPSSMGFPVMHDEDDDEDRGRCSVLVLQFTVIPGAGFSLGMVIHHSSNDSSATPRHYQRCLYTKGELC